MSAGTFLVYPGDSLPRSAVADQTFRKVGHRDSTERNSKNPLVRFDCASLIRVVPTYESLKALTKRLRAINGFGGKLRREAL